ncbi:hypothetical protein [Methanocaldococcus lauensis]|uniref:hypothetical protein n=1 Tax=Methanocaldococcus lauensis TaxID=2546128 RepID=UPI001BDCBE6E|nr:hypothetical protein [Methanocaldococcus lauensis]
MNNNEKEFEKRKLLYNTIFDLYKLFLGAGLTLLVAIVVKVAFSEGNPINGLGLVLLDIVYMAYTTLIFGGALHQIYKTL